MKQNPMKAKLLTGEPVFGCSIMVPSPQMVEMVAHAGFDWVLIDMEHGTIGLETAELMIMAAEASGITPVARPPTNRMADISSVMDRGAMGVQVPHVNSAEDARAAVSAVKFGSGNNRGLAVGTRPNNYGLGLSLDSFASTANQQTLVCVQLEDTEALENVDDILQVDGIDVFFIGPSDLSQSMGFPGDPKAGPVASAIERTVGKIVDHGKIPGIPASADNLQKILNSGPRYIYTHLPKILGAGASAFLKQAKS